VMRWEGLRWQKREKRAVDINREEMRWAENSREDMRWVGMRWDVVKNAGKTQHEIRWDEMKLAKVKWHDIKWEDLRSDEHAKGSWWNGDDGTEMTTHECGAAKHRGLAGTLLPPSVCPGTTCIYN
jgi:hypothetical protein